MEGASEPRPPARPRRGGEARRCAVLTFNLVFGQVHRRAVGEDVRDGADPPVHQRGGDRVHRHGCDLWLAAARTVVVNERLQQQAAGAQEQLPSTVAEGRGARERVHVCGEGGGRSRGGRARGRRRLPPQAGRRFSIRFERTGEGVGVVCVEAECGEVGCSYLMAALFAFDEWGQKAGGGGGGGGGAGGKFPPNAQSETEGKSTSVETVSCIHIRAWRVGDQA